jgi:hypothetical protein
VYKVTNGSSIGHSLGTGEQSVTAATSIFTNESGNNPEAWSYYPSANSVLINTGTNVNLTTDFAGNPVSNPPEVGILEYI